MSGFLGAVMKDTVGKTMVYGLGGYTVISYAYGGLKRATAPAPKPEPAAPKKAAPAAQTAAVTLAPAPVSGSSSGNADTLAILKDIQTRVAKIESTLQA